jgi:hypothetical protein
MVKMPTIPHIPLRKKTGTWLRTQSAVLDWLMNDTSPQRRFLDNLLVELCERFDHRCYPRGSLYNGSRHPAPAVETRPHLRPTGMPDATSTPSLPPVSQGPVFRA